MLQNHSDSYLFQILDTKNTSWCRAGVGGAKFSLVLRLCDNEVGSKYTEIWVIEYLITSY